MADNEILSPMQIATRVDQLAETIYVMVREAPRADEIRNHLADIRGLMDELKLALEEG